MEERNRLRSEGGRGGEETEKYRSDIHMYIGLGYNVFKLRGKGLGLALYISIGDE